MSDDNLALTPEDILGAVQRRTVDLAQYLQLPVSKINVTQVQEHLLAMMKLVDAIGNAQAHAQVPAGPNGEAHA